MVTDLEKHATTLHIDDADYDAEFTEPQATGTDSSVPTKPSESELNGLPDEFIIFKDVINGIECPTQNDKIFKEECIVTCDSCFSEMVRQSILMLWS